jgi:hypothetical protein
MRPRLPILVRRKLVAASSTTWNPADKGAGVTLSNGNRTATLTTATGDQGTRSTTSKTSGKFVYEVVWNQVGGYADTGAGIALSTAAFTSLGANGTGGFIVFANSGGMFLNGANQGLSGWAASATAMFAVDLTNGKVWFASSNNPGKWNNTTHDPATNTGGYSLSALSGAKFAAIVMSNGATNQAFTANFGQSPFVNSVPAGFSAWG